MSAIHNTDTLIVYDSTLRDGSHALGNSLTADQIEGYARLAEQAAIPFVEIGHGLGIGASSLQSGFSTLADGEIIAAALRGLGRERLCCFLLPGYATVNKDIKPAMALGVTNFRLGCHCTEADVTLRHIDFLKSNGATVIISLTMSHMATRDELLEQGLLVQKAGADGLILMDSAGHFIPSRVADTAAFLCQGLSLPLGFHAHNNLGMAAANAFTAVENGFTIVDGCCCGLGAASGNCQLEVIAPQLEQYGYRTGIELGPLFRLAEFTREHILREIPFSDPLNIVSGLHGITSAFASHIKKVAREFDLDPIVLCTELAKYKPVGGQEDLIVESAVALKARQQCAPDA